MKYFLMILCFLFCNPALADSKKHTSKSYDWKAHQARIDKLFEAHIKEVLKVERDKISSILGAEKTDKYMDFFKKGLRSNTGSILIEGAENRWLELAYYSGHYQKVLFRQGYFQGLTKAAETKTN